ncbi:unnamed protein product [Cyclocybe aegerita]|uniref:DUF6535 domain-containing protein n=1 Tax=Cyclocybe aegerita TaxID=1973307 RepID=A0A8S0WP43_CYCAE|nr:unnamed protein product [Cyclocybe aegerita]
MAGSYPVGTIPPTGRAVTEDPKPATFISGAPKTDEGLDHWATLLEPVQKKDKAQCEAWKDEVQNILIFAGLFSAVVTAFLIESYQNLQEDPSETIVILLTQIAARLENPTNGSLSSSPDLPQLSFSPTSSSIRVNVCWFLSLVVSLTAVLIGIVSLQWLREHQSYPEYFSAEQTLTLLHMRTKMLETWRVSAFFSSLPVLLQAAVILFFVGLADFLHSLHIAKVTIPVILMIAISITFLFTTTIMPTLHIHVHGLKGPISPPQIEKDVPVPSPYKSPQAKLFRHAFSFISSTLSPFFHSLFALIFKKIGERWTDHLPTRTPSADLMLAQNWTELDLKWMSIRRLACLHALPNDFTRYELPGNWSGKDWSAGPFYDQIQSILHVCHHYPFDMNTLESGYHCFQYCITPSTHRDPTDPERKSYLKSLANILIKEGSQLLYDLVDFDDPDVLHDEVLLLFFHKIGIRSVSESWEATTAEVYFRVCSFFFDIPHSQHPSDGSFLPDHLLPSSNLVDKYFVNGFTPEENQGLIQREEEYVQSMFSRIADRSIDWLQIQLIPRERLKYRVTEYARNLSEPPSLTGAIAFLKSCLDSYSKFTQDVGNYNLDTTTETRAIQSYIMASVVCEALSDKVLKTPEELEEIRALGTSLDNFCETLISSSETSHGKRVFKLLKRALSIPASPVPGNPKGHALHVAPRVWEVDNRPTSSNVMRSMIQPAVAAAHRVTSVELEDGLEGWGKSPASTGASWVVNEPLSRRPSFYQESAMGNADEQEPAKPSEIAAAQAQGIANALGLVIEAVSEIHETQMGDTAAGWDSRADEHV